MSLIESSPWAMTGRIDWAPVTQRVSFSWVTIDMPGGGKSSAILVQRTQEKVIGPRDATEPGSAFGGRLFGRPDSEVIAEGEVNEEELDKISEEAFDSAYDQLRADDKFALREGAIKSGNLTLINKVDHANNKSESNKSKKEQKTAKKEKKK